MLMPEKADHRGEAEITELNVSAGDKNGSILVRGWAFLEGCDAMESTVYLVVSAKAGAVHRFYVADIKPGASGVTHDPAKGQNLERADFQAAFKVNTYEEGPYRLGILVENREKGKRQAVQGYFTLGNRHQFQVKNNAVVGVG
jgi:hypothetical protein